jgi:N utilization substance protein A
VREAGDRAKVAVSRASATSIRSAARRHARHARAAIIRELRGEKIDIVEWSEDPSLVTKRLSPACVQRVSHRR